MTTDRFSRLVCKRATTDTDAQHVFSILEQCGLDMKERYQLSHWIPPYPLSTIHRDMTQERVYLVWDYDHHSSITSGGEIVDGGDDDMRKSPIATFAIFSDTPSYLVGYPHWRNGTEEQLNNVFYLKKLAVVPRAHGTGLGTWCMQQMEHIILYDIMGLERRENNVGDGDTGNGNGSGGDSEHSTAPAPARCWIRLDCTEAVPNLVSFYEKRGYEKRSLWKYHDGVTDIMCMEKAVK